MNERDSRARKIQAEIRHLLLTQWDPLGVKDEPKAQDEYDGYVGVVYRLLADGSSAQSIIDHLRQVERGEMGLTPSPPAQLATVVKHLRALDVSLGTNGVRNHDDDIVNALDAAPHALALEELVSRLGGSNTDLEADLMRLAELGRVKMTADKATRAYYTRSIQLK